MKYILIISAFFIALNAKAQNDFKTTPDGSMYKIFTSNTGDKIKVDDIITFNFIEKTDKDSILASSYLKGAPVQTRIVKPQNISDLMQVFPLLTIGDSVLVHIPTDTIFSGHDDKRPSFFPKGSKLVVILKILRVQSLNDAIAERNAMIEKVKAAESADAAKYVASHKLVLKTTPSGLQYVITKPSLKLKPQKGDTVFVNYVGRGLDDRIFDTSIALIAKATGTYQEGRPYEPIQITLGTGAVIPGWDEGLLLLNEGAKATFVIPSHLAYGATGQGEIKPYSTLVFDVELVKVKPIKHPPAVKPPVHKKIVKKAS